MTDRKLPQQRAAPQRPPGRKPPSLAPARPVEARSLRAAVDRPDSASPEGILAAQRAFGNRAVNQSLQRAATAGSQAPHAQPAPRAAANRTGLPDRLKAGVEALSGFSLDNVRVHYNSARPAPVQAKAYAQGSEIHLAPGQERHLPHETWHVVQQAQGRVQANLQLNGLPINSDPALEHEADVMGQRAAARPAALPAQLAPLRPAKPPVMRVAQLALQDKIKDLVFQSTHPRAKDVIAELAAKAEARKPAYEEETFGPADLKNVAKSMQYQDEYADRLSKAKPFTLKDIPARTEVTDKAKDSMSLTTFDQGATEPATHQLIFANKYDQRGHATMVNNYLNPLLADFTALDVVDYQTSVALPAKKGLFGGSKPTGITAITRKNIQSVNGRVWLDKHFPDENARRGEMGLDENQLATFLTDTDNGRSSVKIAQRQGTEIIAGSITFEADKSFNVTLTLGKLGKKKEQPKKTLGLRKKSGKEEK